MVHDVRGNCGASRDVSTTEFRCPPRVRDRHRDDRRDDCRVHRARERGLERERRGNVRRSWEGTCCRVLRTICPLLYRGFRGGANGGNRYGGRGSVFYKSFNLLV